MLRINLDIILNDFLSFLLETVLCLANTCAAGCPSLFLNIGEGGGKYFPKMQCRADA